MVHEVAFSIYQYRPDMNCIWSCADCRAVLIGFKAIQVSKNIYIHCMLTFGAVKLLTGPCMGTLASDLKIVIIKLKIINFT